MRNPQSFSINMTTTSPSLDDYSSEDYEDCDDYCVVPEVSQTTHPINHETHNNEALNLMMEWPEVTTPRSNQVVFSSESDDDDEVPNMENEVEESDSKAILITTGAPATSNSLTALTVMDWTREATRVPIHRRQDLETMMSGNSSPVFICGTMLKNWIEQFLFEIARFRIRFYRSIAAAFRKVTGWATRWTTRKEE